MREPVYEKGYPSYEAVNRTVDGDWTKVDFTDEQLDKMIAKFSQAPAGSDEYWIFQLLMDKRYGSVHGST